MRSIDQAADRRRRRSDGYFLKIFYSQSLFQTQHQINKVCMTDTNGEVWLCQLTYEWMPNIHIHIED